MIRPATIHDVPRISEIVNSHAELGKMLFKSFAQLYEALRDFAVYELDGEVVGCVALAIIWADMTEIRSLAVDDQYQGRGLGRRLTEWCVEEARRLQIRRIMSLTYEQAFFEKMGFEAVSKDTPPPKSLERLRPLPQARCLRRNRHGPHPLGRPHDGHAPLCHDPQRRLHPRPPGNPRRLTLTPN